MTRHVRLCAGIALAAALALASACATNPPPSPPGKTSGGGPTSGGARCAAGGTYGIEVGELSRAARTRIGAPDDLVGVVVTYVYAGGPGAKAGIAVGDVVTAVGEDAIETDCAFLMVGFNRQCERGTVATWRAGAARTVTITPADTSVLMDRLCRGGIAQACFRQGWQIWSNPAGEADRVRARALYQRACDAGAGDGCAYLSIALGETGAQAEAYRAAEKACALDNAPGCAHLAYYTVSGTVVAKDETLATAQYVKSCDLGDAKGCYNVGLMYGAGRGVEKDEARARLAYAEACRGGSALACTNLGWMVQNGVAGPTDEEEAFALYQRGCRGSACEASNLLGCVNVGRAYRDGIGVVKSPALAAEAYAKVCEADADTAAREPAQVTKACALLGGMHLDGSAPLADGTKGRALSARACEGGDDFGCFNAATAYATGLGGAVDQAAAYKYFALGCDVDDAESCYEQAQRLDTGKGVPRDRAKARTLMQKACAGGFAKACPATRRR